MVSHNVVSLLLFFLCRFIAQQHYLLRINSESLRDCNIFSSASPSMIFSTHQNGNCRQDSRTSHQYITFPRRTSRRFRGRIPYHSVLTPWLILSLNSPPASRSNSSLPMVLVMNKLRTYPDEHRAFRFSIFLPYNYQPLLRRNKRMHLHLHPNLQPHTPPTLRPPPRSRHQAHCANPPNRPKSSPANPTTGSLTPAQKRSQT